MPERTCPRAARAALMLGLLVLALLATAAPAHAASAHGTVRIVGDTGFDALGLPGNGTADDPYIIEGWAVLANKAHGIELTGTTKHVVIRDVRVELGTTAFDGIRLVNTQNVTISRVTLETNRVGLYVESSGNLTVDNATIRASGVGIRLQNVRDALVQDNRIALNTIDVRLDLSAGNRFTRNNLSIVTGQTGFHFGDNQSYDNAIDASNVVNGVPMRWYVRQAGTQAAPIILAHADVRLKGITNVAQVMLYRVENATLADPTASGGTSNGIVVHAGRDILLQGVNAEQNAAAGVFVEMAQNVTLRDSGLRVNAIGARFQSSPGCLLDGLVVAANAQQGVRFQSTPGCTVQASALRDNTGAGLHATSSPGTQVLANDLRGNKGGGLALEQSPGARIHQNAVVGNGLAGMRLDRSPATNLTQNVLESNAAAGLHLAGASSGTQVAGNRFEPHAQTVRLSNAPGATFRNNAANLTTGTGYHFDDEASHDTDLDTTNLINGKPLQWYWRVAGTAEAPLLIDGVDARQRATNIAQVMVYAGRNLTFRAPVGTAGAGAGFLIEQADNVTLQNADASFNDKAGIHVVGGRNVRILDANASANGADGIRLARQGAEHVVERAKLERNALMGAAIVESTHAQIRDSDVRQNGRSGLHAASGAGASLVGNTIGSNAQEGIRLEGASGTLVRNTLERNGDAGILLLKAISGSRVESNVITGHPYGVRLVASQGASFQGNTVTLSSAGYGFHFDSPASYSHDIAPTNKINGTSMRWYVGLHGTPGAPIMVNDAVVTQPRITNVAQILVLGARNVTLADAVATRGSGAGILVLDSEHVNLTGARAEDNALSGIVLERGHHNSAQDATSRRNGEHGVKLGGVEPAIIGGSFDDNHKRGVSLQPDAVRPLVQGAAIARNTDGVVIERAQDARVKGNTVSANRMEGVQVTAAPRARLESNVLYDNARQVRITGSSGGDYANNTLTLTRGGQYGFHFDDETSYANRIGTTNKVDGTPVQWHANLLGPITLTNVTVGVANMTNVAQVMVYRSTDVTLAQPFAANGSAAGIRVHKSERITLQSPSTEANAGAGISVTASPDTRVEGGALLANRGPGLMVGAGSDRAAVRNATIAGNAGGVTFADVSTGIVHDNTLDDNGAHGVRLDRTGVLTSVERNNLARHATHFRLQASDNNAFRSNLVTLAPAETGYHFDDEKSYDNTFATTNLVNGEPLRWYARLAGTVDEPVRLEGIVAQTRGVTNVAQIMLYRSSYVTVEAANASNGMAHGILIHRSSNVNVYNSTAIHNVNGITLQQALTGSVRDNLVAWNTNGARLEKSSSIDLVRTNATGTAKAILLADGESKNNRIWGTVATSVRDATVIDPTYVADATPRGANLLVDAGFDARTRVNATVTFADHRGVNPQQADPIVMQRIDFGDGQSTERTGAAHFTTQHVYAEPGTYVATYRVTTANGAVYDDAKRVTVSPDLAPPRDLSFALENGNITLSWLPPSHDGGHAISGYRVYRGTDVATMSLVDDLGNRTSYHDTSAIGGTTYFWSVAAVTAAGEGPESAPLQALALTPPSAPLAVSATNLEGNLTIRWTPPAQDGGRARTGYELLAGPAGGPLAPWKAMPAEAALLNTTFDANVTPDSWLAVRAINEIGTGPASEATAVRTLHPPAMPSALEGTAADRVARLHWAPSTGADHYRVYRATDDGTFVLVQDGLQENAYVDADVENGVVYRYAVSAVNDDGESPHSAQALVTPLRLDTDAPLITNLTPENGAVLPEGDLNVSATYSDASGIRLNATRLTLDGADITAQATMDAAGIRYQTVNLSAGRHTLVLTVVDGAGNEARKEWRFDIKAPEARSDGNLTRPTPPTLGGQGTLPSELRLTQLRPAASPVPPGAAVAVFLEAQNVGNAPLAATLALLANNIEVATVDVDLGPGESKTLVFSFTPSKTGLVALRVADQGPVLLRVQADAPPAPPVDAPAAAAIAEAAQNVTAEAVAGAAVEAGKTLGIPGAGVGATLVAIGAFAALRRRK